MESQQKHKNITKSKILFLLCFLSLFSNLLIYGQKEYIVVLDAGHGGKDPGNLGNGYLEKDIALKVTLIVGKELQKQKDIKVIYTRKKDTYPALWKRGEIANDANADLFVSIHCDSYSPKPSAHGAGTFVLGLRGNKRNLEIAKRENASILLEDDYQNRYKGFDPNSAESVIGLSLLQEENLDKSLAIASLIQNNFAIKLKREDRKVKQDNFQVLRETIMPSVLVELGFLTNKKEGRYLNSSKGQLQMSIAIANAVKSYINNLKINTVVEEVVSENGLLNNIEFKVQIASSRNKLAEKPYNFKGLKDIERVRVNSYYKYYYGNTSSYKQARELLEIVKRKGYASAFLIAFKNGEKISVQEAVKMQ